MLVRFWGTRGSIPTPIRSRDIKAKIARALLSADGRRFTDLGEATAFINGELEFPVADTYGGDSSCVELDLGQGDFMVFDMGSGLRRFGIDAVKRFDDGRPRTFNIFLSHMHWDHIMGFPFFSPAFVPGCKINFFGGHHDVEHALRRQQDRISSPVPLDAMAAEMVFTTLTPGETHEISGCKVGLIKQNHDYDSFGYRVEHNRKTIIYTTDAEHNGEDSAAENAFVDFLHGADLVIADTMYSLGTSIQEKKGWGHSSGEIVVDLCRRAKVKRLAMFHHDPLHDDQTMYDIFSDTVLYEARSRSESVLEVLCASDDLEIPL